MPFPGHRERCSCMDCFAWKSKTLAKFRQCYIDEGFDPEMADYMASLPEVREHYSKPAKQRKEKDKSQQLQTTLDYGTRLSFIEEVRSDPTSGNLGVSLSIENNISYEEKLFHRKMREHAMKYVKAEEIKCISKRIKYANDCILDDWEEVLEFQCDEPVLCTVDEIFEPENPPIIIEIPQLQSDVVLVRSEQPVHEVQLHLSDFPSQYDNQVYFIGDDLISVNDHIDHDFQPSPDDQSPMIDLRPWYASRGIYQSRFINDRGLVIESERWLFKQQVGRVPKWKLCWWWVQRHLCISPRYRRTVLGPIKVGRRLERLTRHELGGVRRGCFSSSESHFNPCG